MLLVSSTIRIPKSEFQLSFARSSGAGGQNVNKVNSKAILVWKPLESRSLRHDIKIRFFQKFQNRLTLENEIIIQSDRYRDQPKNIQDCYDKLTEMLLSVAEAPKIRKKTKPSYSSRTKRMDSKKVHANKKQNRKRVL